VFEPAFGLVLRPEIAAITMAGSSLLVAVNALTLKQLRLPTPAAQPAQPTATRPKVIDLAGERSAAHTH